MLDRVSENATHKFGIYSPKIRVKISISNFLIFYDFDNIVLCIPFECVGLS